MKLDPRYHSASRGGRLRIAHILPWPTVGGIEVATLRIAQAVRERGLDSVAFCPGPDTPIGRLFTEAGFETAVYSPAEPSYRRPGSYLAASVRLARELRHRRINLVHCSDILGAMYGGLGGRLARLPVLCQVRNRYADLSRRDQSFLSLVQHFVFVSRDTWRHFAMPVPAHRGTVVYDGFDVDVAADGRARAAVCAEFGIPEQATIVGMVARVAAQKDYFTLARAASRLVRDHPDVRFLIVGDHTGTEKYRAHHAAVRAALQELGIAEHFVFAGFRSDVGRFLEAMDIFVLSTHVEGLPLVIIEAAAYAKPIVATDVDGVPEVLHHRQTGLLVPHQDHAALAAHLLELIRDPALARRLGNAARERALSHFGAERFATSMEDLYHSVLARA